MADIDYLRSKLAIVHDFPIKGIVFQDFLPILRDPKAFEILITHLIHHLSSTQVPDVIVGLDARGFLIGPIVALRLSVPFVAVRKKGKLPGEVDVVGYQKEYGTDYFAMQKGSVKEGDKVVVIDDLIATGGSCKAAIDLVKLNKGTVIESVFIIEISDLKGRQVLDCPVYSMIQV